MDGQSFGPEIDPETAVPRIDARAKVTGEARYAADMPLTNVAYGVLVTSSIARGRLANANLAAALGVRGVLDIITYGDADALAAPKFGNTAAASIAPLREPRIWHDGQIVALVVADTFEAAREAALRVETEYTVERPAATFDQAGTELLPAVGNTQRHKDDPAVGDFAAAFAAAPVTVSADYSTPTQHHNPIELFSSTCVWHGDELVLYEPSQNVHGFRNELARQLNISPDKVRVVSPFIGGAFGSKGPLTARTAIVALAARKLNRPVRCVVSRMQGFTTATYRAETRHRIALGATPDGKITAFSHQAQEVTSRPDNYVVGGTETTARLYGYGAVQTRVELVKADRNTPGYMRSPPEFPYVFALETALDELAEKLNMDPVELRRINDTMHEPIKGARYTSRSLMACFEQAAAAFGWDFPFPPPGTARDGDWLVGRGCASAVYPTNTAACTARVRLTADGKVQVATASHEIGTGIRTVAAQMAAERLGVPLDAVQVAMGDTNLPPAPVSGGSNSTASVCSTIIKACDAIRDRLAQFAGKAGTNAAAVAMRDGHLVFADGRTLPLADAFNSGRTAVVEEYAEWLPKGVDADAAKKLYAGVTSFHGGTEGDTVSFALGAEFVEVRVHALTGEIVVPRIVGAFSAGRIMNPRTARSQLMGGMIWGIGSALHEITEIDLRTARYVNRDIAEYHVPVNADVREVEVILVPEQDDDVNPAGVKGLGELGNVGTAAAIVNAVYQATGRRVRDLPVRIEKILRV